MDRADESAGWEARSATRERVRRAIEASVGDATKLLSEAQDADEHTRLGLLVTGWFRGLAAALEELAVEIDQLRDERWATVSAGGAAEEGAPKEVATDLPRDEEGEAPPRQAEVDEEALIEQARASLEQTEALRRESGAEDAATDEGGD